MALPPFAATGDLPVAVHCATVDEVLLRFGAGTRQRQIVALRLERLYRLARMTGCLARFVLVGSFVTDKPRPNDVDLFLIMDDAFDLAQLAGEARLLFDHTAAQAFFGASVFWLRRSAIFVDEQSAIEDWQVKRDGERRGVVEIIEGSP